MALKKGAYTGQRSDIAVKGADGFVDRKTEEADCELEAELVAVLARRSLKMWEIRIIHFRCSGTSTSIVTC